jgi:hypothetical protein
MGRPYTQRRDGWSAMYAATLPLRIVAVVAADAIVVVICFMQFAGATGATIADLAIKPRDYRRLLSRYATWPRVTARAVGKTTRRVLAWPGASAPVPSLKPKERW